MKKSVKAALISTFIFPGVGHLYLKQYLTGTILAGISLAAIAYLLDKTLERAAQISAAIQSGAVRPDIQTITALASEQPGGADAQLLNVATIALLVCWLIGIIDAYRAGAAHDKRGNT